MAAVLWWPGGATAQGVIVPSPGSSSAATGPNSINPSAAASDTRNPNALNSSAAPSAVTSPNALNPERNPVHLRAEHLGAERPDAGATSGRRRAAAAPSGIGPSRPCPAWGACGPGRGQRRAKPSRDGERASGAQHRGVRVPRVLRELFRSALP